MRRPRRDEQDLGKSQRNNGSRQGSPYGMIGLGFEMAVPVVLFLFAGYKLDQWLGSTPWLLVLGAFLGMIVGFYSLYKRVVRSTQGGR
jgi:ATP synthase protein I